MGTSAKKLPPHIKDMLWHGGKALICLLQFYILSLLSWDSIETLADGMVEEPNSWPFRLLYVVVQVVYLVVLWKYYDNNDDRAFDLFCAAEETPNLLREPAYLVGLGITVVGGTAVCVLSLYPLWRVLFPAMATAALMAMALAAGLALVGGFSVWRLHRLTYVWGIQKTLRRPEEKRMKPVKRALWAIVLFVSLIIAAAAVPTLVVVFGFFFRALLLVVPTAMAILAVLLAGLEVYFLIRQFHDRRKFLRRLERLRDRGELSFTIHGRPYLSLISRRVEYGLTITDTPHPDSRVRTDTTYCVAVANCNHRRMMVVLCPDHIFQFVYSFKLRAVGSIGFGRGDIMTIPLASFFRSHRFTFPEGEGKRILLVDPAPANLVIRGFRAGEFLPQDNASTVFDYTVYGKNAFISMLERT